MKSLRNVALQAIRATRWIPASGENRITGMVLKRVANASAINCDLSPSSATKITPKLTKNAVNICSAQFNPAEAVVEGHSGKRK